VPVGPGPKLGLEPHLGVHVHSAARVEHRVAPQVDLEGKRAELLERFVAPDDTFLPAKHFVERLHASRERVVVEVVKRVPLGVAPVACRPRLPRRRRSHKMFQVRVAAARVVNVPSARVAFDEARARVVSARPRAEGISTRRLPAGVCRGSKRRACREAAPGRRAPGPPAPASSRIPGEPPASFNSLPLSKASYRDVPGARRYRRETPLTLSLRPTSPRLSMGSPTAALSSPSVRYPLLRPLWYTYGIRYDVGHINVFSGLVRLGA